MYKYLLVALLFVTPAAAVEPLSSEEFLERCASSEKTELAACRGWIHGFVGGAFATRTAKPATAKEKETFEERAARTRIGRGRNLYGQNYTASYCIPKETTIDDLVVKLQDHAANAKKLPEHANQLMLAMLRKQYPCSK